MGPELHLVPMQRRSDWIVTVVEAESPIHIDGSAAYLRRRRYQAAGSTHHGGGLGGEA